jgi:hypothetical protein
MEEFVSLLVICYIRILNAIHVLIREWKIRYAERKINVRDRKFGSIELLGYRRYSGSGGEWRELHSLGILIAPVSHFD